MGLWNSYKKLWIWNSYKKLWTKPLAKLRGDGGTPVHVDASTFPVEIVTAENGACECDDSFYRDPEGGCIHYRRLQYATGERDIPDWVNHDRVDPQLGQHVDRGKR